MIVDFFKSLFKSDSNTDEKIVVGFISFAMMVIMGLSNVFFGLLISYEIFATFGALTFACFGLGTFASIKNCSLNNNNEIDQQNTNQDNQQTKNTQ